MTVAHTVTAAALAAATDTLVANREALWAVVVDDTADSAPVTHTSERPTQRIAIDPREAAGALLVCGLIAQQALTGRRCGGGAVGG